MERQVGGWLNYQHLLYFWTVAREGGVLPAARRLGLTHSTIGAQVHALEEMLGEPLLVRSGRNLVPTAAGQLALEYADEIFSLGRELREAIGRSGERRRRLHVGLTPAVPKLVAYRLLAPVMRDASTHLTVIEDDTDRLVANLSIRRLDVVLSDSPVGAGVKVRAFNHLLGECGVTFFAARSLAEQYRAGFPESLDGAPFLLPSETTALRRALDRWADERALRLDVVAELEDSALVKVFGQHGAGVFVAPSAIEAEIEAQYRVSVVGRANDLRERYYAITGERRVRHAGVRRITEDASASLFASP
jgi:LysR family transcriptional activator of nhaA